MSSPASNSAMKDEATTALLPKLRFPEFHGEALRSVLLGDVTEECRSRNGSKHSDSSVMGVTKADGIVPMETRLIAADIARYKLVETDWFAYNPMRLNIGSIARWEGEREILVSPDYVVFKCITDDESGCYPGFLDHFRQTKTWEEFVTKGGDGSVRVRIYYKDIARVALVLPPFLEQQKIDECLGSVEELITAQARKVAALKTHKKGLMQQLFPREGETQPRLRFPEFQNAGEWKVKPLGKLVELQSGFAFSSSNFGSEGTKLVTPKNFTKYGHGNFDEIVSKYTTEEVPERFICSPGDLLVLLTDLTPTCELLGKPLLLEDKDGTVLLNQRVARVEPCASKLEALFLKYVFLSESYSNRIVKTATGSTVKHSSNKVLQEIPLFHPALPEQQRIASCLNSLDALITAETSKHEALKTHKKGLMQLLFPSPEEDEP